MDWGEFHKINSCYEVGFAFSTPQRRLYRQQWSSQSLRLLWFHGRSGEPLLSDLSYADNQLPFKVTVWFLPAPFLQSIIPFLFADGLFTSAAVIAAMVYNQFIS